MRTVFIIACSLFIMSNLMISVKTLEQNTRQLTQLLLSHNHAELPNGETLFSQPCQSAPLSRQKASPIVVNAFHIAHNGVKSFMKFTHPYDFSQLVHNGAIFMKSQSHLIFYQHFQSVPKSIANCRRCISHSSQRGQIVYEIAEPYNFHIAHPTGPNFL